MQKMDIQAIYPKKQAKNERNEHTIYPYLLKDVKIMQPNQVWSTDITYIPLQQGFMYLVAVIDWYSRYVLAWQLSNTLDGHFCQVALQQALSQGQPDIFNTDQGVQFTAHEFTDILKQANIQISMDGRGRALDNIFIERFWRSLKYEDIYLRNYACVPELIAGLKQYFTFYNYERPHQSLDYQVPAEVHITRHPAQRQQVLDQVYVDHPERFVKGPPQHPQLPKAVWINPPNDNPDGLSA